jgi:predicted DNA-binding WGR domain protein
MIKLSRTDRSKNMHRIYTYQIGVTLFGEMVLIKEWGRIGFAGRVKKEFFNSPDLAMAALKRHQAAKMRRGYSVTRA